jgi:hypothetical protein
MKAKIMKVLDNNNPEKELFGVKITGLRRPIFGADENGIISISDKKEVESLIKQFNKKFESNPQIEIKLRENKTIQGVRL